MRSVTITLLVCLGTLVMAQNAPEFGQVWHAISEEPTTALEAVDGEWNTFIAGTWWTYGQVMWDGEMYRYYVSASGPGPEFLYSIGMYTAPHLDSAWVPYGNNPVFEGDPESWDNLDVSTPCVMKDGDLFKMWYSGWNTTLTGHIGYATSADGYTWNRHAEPVLTYDPDSNWEDGYFISPHVLKEDDGTYKMWYTARGGDPLSERIGLAISDDGIEWTRSPANPVIDLDDVQNQNWVGYPTVKRINDQYVMWYSGGNAYPGDGPMDIYVAISEDGIIWRKDQLYGPMVEPGPAGSWLEGGSVCMGVFVEDGIYKMIHSGADVDLETYALRSVHYDPTIIPGGNVSGSWTKSGSPYRVEGTITVPDGETLTVEPGTTVEFLNQGSLIVEGCIQAQGTQDERIRFRVDDTLGFYDDAAVAGVWGGFRFNLINTMNDSSLLEHCDIEFGHSQAASMSFSGGGAMKIDEGFSKLRVENCLIQYNRAIRTDGTNYAYGGALDIDVGSNPDILYNTIQYNYARHLADPDGGTGGGICVRRGSQPLIMGNIIRWNQAAGSGGGLAIWSEESEPELINNLIVENNAVTEDGLLGYGGGVATGIDANPRFINNTIANNSAGWGGGGFCVNGGDATIINTIIANNTWLNAPDTVQWGHDMAMYDNSMVGYHVDLYYSCLEGGPDLIQWGTNNSDSPQTVNFIESLDNDPQLWSNLELGPYSPCIGSGAATVTIGGTSYEAPLVDYDGDPRPQPEGSNPDMGALEHPLPEPTGVDDITGLPAGFRLHQNYPNPFNPVTSIRYSISENSDVHLIVYDLTGREVQDLVNQSLDIGVYEIQWDGMDSQGRQVATGVYFARLTAAHQSDVIKMVYLR